MTNSLFNELSVWQRRAVDRMFERRTFGIGDELMVQGEAGGEFMVVFEGQVAVMIDGVQTRTVPDGGFFGELALLPEVAKTEGRRVATVVATETTTVGVIGEADFALLMEQYPRLGGRILAQAWSLTSNLEWSAPSIRSAASSLAS